jgi:thioredoxin-like negative regulator of GroEL
MLTEVEPLDRQAAEAKPRLVFFYCSTCGASRRTEALLGHVLQHNRNHDTFVVHKVDVQARPDLAKRFAVRDTPAVCVVDEKRVVARAVRPRTVAQITALLQPWLRGATVGRARA